MIDLDPNELVAARHRLAGRYRLDAVVAQGAAGAVFLGRDEDVDVEVAVKLVSPALARTEAEVAAFVEATNRRRGLHDPALVRIYEVGADGGRAFYTMPYMEGLTLREVMDVRAAKGLTFTVAEVLPLFGQLANALDVLAPVGPHGALRPSSVMVMSELLKATGSSHLTGLPRDRFVSAVRAQGGLAYLAPEVRDGKGPLGPTSDVYSLAAILCEMLAGVVGSLEAEPWGTVRERLPGRLALVLRRGLAPSITERYPDVRSLLAAVSETAAEAPTAPLSVPPLERAPSPRRVSRPPTPAPASVAALASPDGAQASSRRPVLVIGAVVAALAAAGVGIFVAGTQEEPPVPAPMATTAALTDDLEEPEDVLTETLEVEMVPPEGEASLASDEPAPPPGTSVAEAARPDAPEPQPGKHRFVLRPAKRAKARPGRAAGGTAVASANAPLPPLRQLTATAEQQALPPEPPPLPPLPAPAPPPRAAADEPVVPPVFLSGPPVEYSAEAYRWHVKGNVVATCTITARGTVEKCRVLKSLTFMDASVLKALEGRKYKPATRGGRPIEFEKTFDVKVSP